MTLWKLQAVSQKTHDRHTDNVNIRLNINNNLKMTSVV
jgi:hypothetical protein